MKEIKQTVYFSGSPQEIFELLMDSKKHAGFTGHKAHISRKKNGKFDAYDGWIQGRNLELVKYRKITQSWRGADWKKGCYSKVEFKLEKKGNVCKLTFTHAGVPDEHYNGIKKGWREHYWQKMKKYLKN